LKEKTMNPVDVDVLARRAVAERLKAGPATWAELQGAVRKLTGHAILRATTVDRAANALDVIRREANEAEIAKGKYHRGTSLFEWPSHRTPQTTTNAPRSFSVAPTTPPYSTAELADRNLQIACSDEARGRAELARYLVTVRGVSSAAARGILAAASRDSATVTIDTAEVYARRAAR
jgi:hypothetical protein